MAAEEETMHQSKLIGFTALAILVVTLFLVPGCLSGTNVPNSGSSTPTPAVAKPRPVIESVNAITSGLGNNYYAILEVTLRNEGSDGTAVVSASVTQGNQTQTNEMVTNINHNTTQVLRLTFPLKWKGGDWTQTVQAIVP